jgi:FkbM family methyltransferase
MNKFKYYIVRVLEKTGIITLINFRLIVKLNNHRFSIPFIGSKMGTENVLLAEAWFTDIFQQLKKVISQEECFVDVGMNVGQTLLKVRSVDSTIRYIGFEPNVVCVQYLYKLIRINNIEDIRIFPVGLGSNSEILTLYADNEFASGASMIKFFRQNQKIKFEYNTPVFNGDVILKNEPVGIIKIDVEGFELNVLKGIVDTIKTNRPFIICEILPNYNNEESDRFKRQLELERLLLSLDYVISRIHESKSKVERLVAIGSFNSMMWSGKTGLEKSQIKPEITHSYETRTKKVHQ